MIVCVIKLNFPLTDESKGNNDEQDVLHGLKFRLDGFTEEQETQLQEDIETYGGNVLSNESNIIADFLVAPLNYEYEETRAKNVVSMNITVDVGSGNLRVVGIVQNLPTISSIFFMQFLQIYRSQICLVFPQPSSQVSRPGRCFVHCKSLISYLYLPNVRKT